MYTFEELSRPLYSLLNNHAVHCLEKVPTKLLDRRVGA